MPVFTRSLHKICLKRLSTLLFSIKATMDTSKLKILCLHGYRQSGEHFRKKMGGVRKLMKSAADFEYISSPHIINSDEDNEPADGDPHAWWFTNEETNTYDSKEFESKCFGFEESVKFVESVIREKGPFDGILGFSQGACFLSLLCCLQQQGRLQGSFKFAIFSSGYLSRCVAHQNLYTDKLGLPTLHIFGETDTVIPEDMSKTLAEFCEEKQIIRHPGGHYIPSNAHFKDPYLKFLQARLAEKMDSPER
ncbi:esterase OVCA2 [Thrips palmi]|uniref:Esterase OVCA2 n=1 Tax=Thrips palmi TaxID=161013 RepID=A0A6P8ZAC5_THRPL|nr:esterase OVCA2 [Thrips palmi]